MAAAAPEGDAEGDRAGVGPAFREDAGANAAGCGDGECGGRHQDSDGTGAAGLPAVRGGIAESGSAGAKTDDATQSDRGVGAELRGLSWMRDGPFPLDEELALVPGTLTPNLLEDLVPLLHAGLNRPMV